MDDFSNMNYENSGHTRFAVTVEREKAVKMVKQMKAVAILNMVFGVLYCIGSSLIFGIFSILAGMKLKSASEKLHMLVYGAPDFMGEAIGADLTEYYKKLGMGIIFLVISSVLNMLFSFAMLNLMNSVIYW